MREWLRGVRGIVIGEKGTLEFKRGTRINPDEYWKDVFRATNTTEVGDSTCKSQVRNRSRTRIVDVPEDVCLSGVRKTNLVEDFQGGFSRHVEVDVNDGDPGNHRIGQSRREEVPQFRDIGAGAKENSPSFRGRRGDGRLPNGQIGRGILRVQHRADEVERRIVEAEDDEMSTRCYGKKAPQFHLPDSIGQGTEKRCDQAAKDDGCQQPDDGGVENGFGIRQFGCVKTSDDCEDILLPCLRVGDPAADVHLRPRPEQENDEEKNGSAETAAAQKAKEHSDGTVAA